MELIRVEVASIIPDDAMRDTKATSDAVGELDSCCGCLIGDWYGFYPLGKLVDCD
jgi:hypothetical protein